MDDQIFVKIVDIIATSVKQPELKLMPDSSSRDVEGWDSLQHMMIISEVEKTFAVKFDFMEILDMRTVGDICKAVEKQK